MFKMTEQNDPQVRIANLEARMDAAEMQEKKQKRDRKVNAGIGAVAPVISGAAFYKFLGNEARKAGEFVGETVDAVKVAKRLLTPNSRSAEVETYIARVDPNVAEAYLSDRNENYLARLEDSARLLLDSGGRASENFPGANSMPVKGLRSLKGSIIERTAGIFRGKEETEIKNTEQYQTNYNQMAAIRFSAIGKLRQLNSEIQDYCGKLAINEAKNQQVGEKELRTLEKMANEYNAIAKIAEGTSELSVRDVNDGMKNEAYKAVIGEARDYGIKASDYHLWGTGGLIVGTALAAYIGHKIAKPATVAARGACKTLSAGYRVASKVRTMRRAAKNNKP